MSYARMSGDYSDIYLFATWYHIDIENSHCWECMSCKLRKEPKNTWFDYFHSYHMFNIKAVYRHLRHHTMRGHKVPIDAIQRVVAEYYGVHVSRLQELWPRESWEFNTCTYCGGIAFNEDGASLTPYCDGECGLF